ncbi:MAG: peroxiredoxin-like family protein [Mariprofundaceae bacterium]|nr:peroxiredoxin-like family protein [Mariprofundaceae bacterium]
MLSEQLEAFSKGFVEKVPAEVVKTMGEATDALRRADLIEGALKAGDRAPDFDLPELAGGRVCLTDALRDGPVVISFYRGAWCPYCNLEMQALQGALPEIEAAGGRLIAIAPETAGHAGEMRDKGKLELSLVAGCGQRRVTQLRAGIRSARAATTHL